MIRKAILGVGLALLLGAGPAFAQSSVIIRKPDNSAAVDPANAGNQTTANSSLASLDGKTPALGAAIKSASRPVVLPTDPDLRIAAGGINAADVATSTVSGQGGVTLVTGTPTVGSALTWQVNGHSSLTIQATGTFVATAAVESSADCATYAPTTAKILGTGSTSASVTAPGVFRVDVTGMACVRLRATSYTSGSVTALANASAAPGLTQVLNPVRIMGADGVNASATNNPAPVQSVYGASGVAPVTAALTSASSTSTFTPIAGRGFNVSVWGTFVAAFQLERSFDSGTTWLPITAAGTQLYQWTTPESEQAEETEAAVQYRVRVTSYTSGTLNVRISQ